MLLRLLAMLAVVTGFYGEAHAKRLALVIGNATYTELPYLQKTVGDAEGYRTALSELGFDVSAYHTDLDFRETAEAVGRFIDRIERGDEVAFVFSGHGWSDGRTNFLLPVDSPRRGSEPTLKRLSLPLRNGATGILDEIAARGARLSFSVIDACRYNPFERTGSKSIGLSRGLTRVTPPEGAFIVFSAGEGQEALDRLSNDDPERYSVFSRVFLPLLTSGLTLERAISTAQIRVRDLAASVGRVQSPAYYDETAGESCLTPGGCGADSLSRIGVEVNSGTTVPVAPPPPPVQPSFDAAAEMWRRCDEGDQRYCRALADGSSAYAALARIELQKIPAPVVTVPPPAPIATPPADPCRDYRGVRPGNADCVVENGQAVWISKGPTPAEIARQQAEAARLQAEREQLEADRQALQRERDKAKAALAQQQQEAALRAPGALGPRPAQGEAIEQYDRCIEGNTTKCNNLGTSYEKGISGVQKNNRRAAVSYLRACDGGSMLGCHNLGVMYEWGKGVAKDYSRAVALYRNSCNSGEIAGCTSLGYMYEAGLGVPLDYIRSIKLYRQGCNGNSARGCANLGNMYVNGWGVAQNMQRGRKLIQQGCNEGFEWGCNRLKELK